MADLSTNPAPQDDTDAEVESLDDTDVNFDDIDNEEATDSDSDDSSDTATDDEQLDDEDAESDQQDEEESDDPSADDDTDDTDPELSNEQQETAFKKEMFERRQQDKQAREANIRDQQQEYLAQAESDENLALRQLQIDAYDNKVDRNSNKLQTSYERAVKDFDVLRSNDPAIQRRLDRAIDAFQAQHVTVDAFGNPTDIRADLYQHLQDEADSISELTGIGARQQVQNKTREGRKTTPVPNRSPKTPKVDPDLADFLAEAAKY